MMCAIDRSRPVDSSRYQVFDLTPLELGVIVYQSFVSTPVDTVPKGLTLRYAVASENEWSAGCRYWDLWFGSRFISYFHHKWYRFECSRSSDSFKKSVLRWHKTPSLIIIHSRPRGPRPGGSFLRPWGLSRARDGISLLTSRSRLNQYHYWCSWMKIAERPLLDEQNSTEQKNIMFCVVV